MEKQKTNKREWVKTALIIFLAIMLVLTFFSNTIMNHSLPEVATHSVQPGTINAKIRGSGTVSANETYDVTLSQTRKVRSVMVRVGDEINVGDVLLTLEPMESEELKQAQDTLTDMELSYQKSLIEASNGSASEDHEVQRLQEKYNEALATYQLYSREDPNVLLLQLEKAELELQRLEQMKTDISADLTKAQQNQDYLDAKTLVTSVQTKYDEALLSLESAEEAISRIDILKEEITRQNGLLGSSANDLRHNYQMYIELVNRWLVDPAVYASDVDALINIIQNDTVIGIPEVYGNSVDAFARQLQNAYSRIEPIVKLEEELASLQTDQTLQKNYDDAYAIVQTTQNELTRIQGVISSHEIMIDGIQSNLDAITQQTNEQSAIVATMTKASAAAETLKSAEQALEDKLFEVSLGDSASLDMQHAKEAIEIQKKLIEALSSEADGQEIKSNVSGIVSTIHTSAGNSAGAETPVISITVADRGYTLQIPVTMEQARQVTIGDTADITNFWNGNITATLENIINDSKNPSGGKVLMFRLSGDGIESGTNLTLSIGQRSANYDALIPNSAVRTDANGSFVLVVTAKSSPLGNRYVATRADVQVLASDDTTSAVSGLANGDFVITTSSMPIEAGDQVRLVDNG